MLEKVLYLAAQSYVTAKMNARRVGSVNKVIGELVNVDETLSPVHIWTICQWERTLSDEARAQTSLGNQQVARDLDEHLGKAITALKKDYNLMDEASKLESYKQTLRQDFANDTSEGTSSSLEAIFAGITEGCDNIRASVNLPNAIKSLSDVKLYSLLSYEDIAVEDEAFEYFSSKCLASLEKHLGRSATLDDVLSCAGEESVTGLAMTCAEYTNAIEDLFKPGKSPALMGPAPTSDDIETTFQEQTEAVGIDDATTAKELFKPGVIRFLHGRMSNS